MTDADPVGPDAVEAAVDETDAEGGAAPADDLTAEVDVGQLQKALAEAEAERDQYLDAFQRARADYDNLNKRKTRELMEALDRGAGQLVAQLLGVLDHFGFAMEAARAATEQEGPNAEATRSLAKGVELVHDELLATLKASGLEEIPGVGAQFDPTHHEALLQVASEEELDHPVVDEVLRTGWRFKGRVLRPASVKVAS